MIYTHAPVPCHGRCLRCGRWVDNHASRWRRVLWRTTGIMM